MQNKIRVIRLQKGLTQTALAGKAGLPQGLLSDIERGKRYCYPSARRRIAHALGVTEAALEIRK